MQRNKWIMGLAFAIVMILATACGDGGGSEDNDTSSPGTWDQMKWDEGKWK